jgi:hypothetical protein
LASRSKSILTDLQLSLSSSAVLANIAEGVNGDGGDEQTDLQDKVYEICPVGQSKISILGFSSTLEKNNVTSKIKVAFIIK